MGGIFAFIGREFLFDFMVGFPSCVDRLQVALIVAPLRQAVRVENIFIASYR
jgi:hypothetical protein